MKIASTKERILQYIDFKKITIGNFLRETDIKRGFLDTDKLNATVSDVFIAKIVAAYEDLNIVWLVTGKGEMLIEDGTQIVKGSEYPIHDNVQKFEEPPLTMKRDEEFLEMQRELIRSQKDQISCYKELISELKKEHTDYVSGLDVSKQELKK